MEPDDIEAKVDIHIAGVELGTVRYYHLSDVTLRSNGRKVYGEARYDQETDDIEIRWTYYFDGEQITTIGWNVTASVTDDSTVVDADNVWTGETLEDALSNYITAVFLGAPEDELGEIFDDVLERNDII